MRSVTLERHNERVHEIQGYISERLEKSLTLEILAKQSNLAPFYFHRIFRRVTGSPVHRYIRRLRLEWAAYRLLFDSCSIIDIAFDIGYESHEAFTRAFKQEFGMTPSALRNRPRKGESSASTEDGESPGSVAPEDATPRACEVTVSQQPMRKVAYFQHFGPYGEIDHCWVKMRRWLQTLGTSPSQVRAIGILYDDPTDCSNGRVRYDAGVEVPFDFEPPGPGLGIQLLPRQDTVSVPHHGPQDLLIRTYIRLVVHCSMEEPQRPIRRFPCYEIYRSFPFLDDSKVVQADLHLALEDAP